MNGGKPMDGWPFLLFKRLSADAAIPSYAHDGDSGMDICSVDCAVIPPGSCSMIGTGLAAVIPPGVELQVRPRSGLAKRGVVAAWGTVDSGYRGEIKVTLFNHTGEPVTIPAGSRIAQIVPSFVLRLNIGETDDLGPDTERGADGFGSTGV